MLNRHEGREAGHGNTCGVSADLDRVVVVRPVDDDAVDLAVARAGRAFQVGVHVLDVGAAQVVDGDEVGAAEGLEVDPLDVSGVHGDVADVPEEPEAVPVRGQVDALGGVGAVEQHRVGAEPASDGVAAVARVPDERVVAGAHQRQVVTSVPVDRVVPEATAQQLCSRASGEVVASVPAVERRRDAVGEGAVGLVDPDEIVAGTCVDGDPVDSLPPDLELGLAVVTEVDLEDAGLTGLQAQRDSLAPSGALDLQDAVPELRVLLGGRGLTLRGRDTGRAGDDGGHGCELCDASAVLHADASPLE